MNCFKVMDLFQIPGRSVVVITDKTFEELSRGLVFNIEDTVEIHWEGQMVLQSRIAGLEHCNPWSPKRPFAFLLPDEVEKMTFNWVQKSVSPPKPSSRNWSLVVKPPALST